MLSRSYRDLFSYLISTGHLASNLNIFPHSGYRQPSGEFSQLLPRSPISPSRHFHQNHHLPRGHIFHPIWIASLLANFAIFVKNRHSSRGDCSNFSIFAKSAIFTKITNFATLQGASFRIQFELPVLWRLFVIFAIHFRHFVPFHCQYRQNYHSSRGHI